MNSAFSNRAGNTPVTAPSPLYFDHAASALPHPRLADWFAELNSRLYLNPHGGTKYAEIAKREIIAAENTIREIIGAEDAFIVWTSGITESLNLAVHSLAIVETPAASHLSLAEPVKIHSSGNSLSGPGARAVGHVNSETGEIACLEEEKKKAKGGLLLVDAAQSFCKIPIPWDKAGIDMLALSSRKIGGPAAVGALVVRRGLTLKPVMHGGGQQKGYRPGTMDTVGIVLFSRVAAARAAAMKQDAATVASLNEKLWKTLHESGLHFIRLSPEKAYPGIAAFALPGYDGAVVARILAEREGILLSSASACTAETGRPSPSLTAWTGSEELARSAVRVSLSPDNTTGKIKTLATALKRTIDNF